MQSKPHNTYTKNQIIDNPIIDKSALILEWQKLFNRPAPVGCHVNFLHQTISWQMQAKQRGGLSSAERKLLLGESSSLAVSSATGTRLIRVWKGETHQVTVLDDGYRYKDQHWKSLSAIAKEITGTPWSGPAFFGLKKSS